MIHGPIGALYCEGASSVLQCVVVCCSALQLCCSWLQCVAVCCSVLQCVAVYVSVCVLQCESDDSLLYSGALL